MEENMFCDLELDSFEVLILMKKLKKYITENNELENLEKFVLEKIINIEYEADCEYYIELHVYEIDPLMKYILKEIDNKQTNKKEKMILNKILDRLHVMRKQYEYVLQKSRFISDHQRYLIMLDDLER